MASATLTLAPASVPVLRALLDQAVGKDYHGGVLGVRARPVWTGPATFEHRGKQVRVVACPSALAVREALRERSTDQWLVVLTDRDEQDLGLGILAHLVFRTLRRPDPWEAVRTRFGAARIDQRLVTAPEHRELATGLLAATPDGGWPVARAGLLTADHAFAALAAARLGLGGGPDSAAEIDGRRVLDWSSLPRAAGSVADLRALAGDVLTEALLDWLADRGGGYGDPLRQLLRAGRVEDLVPLGLVAGVVAATAAGSGPRALFNREAGSRPSDQALSAWASEATDVVAALVTGAETTIAGRLLARADTLLRAAEAADHAESSDVLPRGLTARLARLADALRAAADSAAPRAQAAGPDQTLVDPARTAAVEEGYAGVAGHLLAGRPEEVRVPRAAAAVRLVRWLATELPPAAGLGALVARHRDEDAWVDRAVADAWTGVGDPVLARALQAVLGAVRLRRDAHDAAFAAALAAEGADAGGAPAGTVLLEDLLPSMVLPLARRVPTLLVVADGMTVAVATEVVEDLERRYEWLEVLPDGDQPRPAGLAVLPTLTDVSRTSLLSGRLTRGGQADEQRGFHDAYTRAGVTGVLFHKQPLDSTAAGHELAADVTAALDDVASTNLVACVLNTVDDALDRSDPGGTEWTADAVKHLRPLLDRAQRAGRVIVLTADHGHVLERREGRVRAVPGSWSNRCRPAGGPGPEPGEIAVRGRRVLTDGSAAVLAVDERLRYGPLKAGYHGGGSPAEAVVPVFVLAPGSPPEGWRLAPPRAPAWWRAAAAAPRIVPAPPAPGRAAEPATPTLFDTEPALVPTPAPTIDRGASLAAAVLGSATYRSQRGRAARGVTDDQVRRLLQALLAAPGGRLDSASAAAALGVAELQLTGAVLHAQRLLNIEQYPVLARDADGRGLVLDEALLHEQFEVPR